MAKRPNLPKDVETAVLTNSRRRCCLCFHLKGDLSEKKGQIAHLDHDPSNNDETNLAFLCLDHHDEYDRGTSQAKGLTVGEVRHAASRLHAMQEAKTGIVLNSPSPTELPAKTTPPPTVQAAARWKAFVVPGSAVQLQTGKAVKSPSPSTPPYWLSGTTTVILGRDGAPPPHYPTETVALWNVPVDPVAIRHFDRGFLVLACLRYFGGLHCPEYDRRVDVYVNDVQVDGFALRVIPPAHSDYFYRPASASIPDLLPFGSCQTLYAWPILKETLIESSKQVVRVRLDANVRWDVDYAGFLLSWPKVNSIFLSHAWSDKPVARRLTAALRERGISVWLDEAEMKLGDSLIRKISDAIDTVEYLLVLLSRASVASEWVRKEVEIAMTQEIEGRRVKVLPVRLEDCHLPGFLRGKLYAELRSPADDELVVQQIEARLLSREDEF